MRPRLPGNTRRRVIAVAALLGASAAAGMPAYAYWTDADAPTATLAAAALGAPGATTDPTSTSITVTVSAPPSGPAPTGYTVTRGGTTVCTPAGPGDCTETGLDPDTPYTYQVTAHLGTHWTATATVTASTLPPGTAPAPEPAPGETGAGSADTTGPGSADPNTPGPDTPATGPAPTSLALAGDGDGTAEAGETVTLTLDRPLAPGSLCDDWSGDAPDGHTLDGATVTLTPGADEARLVVHAPDGTCDSDGTPAFHLGTVGLAAGYVAGDDPVEFTGSTAALDADRTAVTITLGTLATGEPGTVTGPGPATFTPGTGRPTDDAGTPVADDTTPVTPFTEDDAGSF